MHTIKFVYLLVVFSIISCNNTSQDTTSNTVDSIVLDTIDSIVKEPDETGADTSVTPVQDKPQQPASPTKVYSNARFKDVTVEKIGDNKYTIRGKGQIFEANFGWVVEDGHNEIKEGYDMTDAGAPEWGNFKFTIEVAKQRPNSTLTLILFETSAKDGSRVYELPIVLE